MTFEEQLNRAFETLTERLRGEIDHHVQRVSAELVAAAPYDRDPALLDAAREELARAVAAARHQAHEDGVAAGRDAGREELRRELADVIVTPPADAGIERFADSVRAIDAARSLTDILDTLVTMASHDASGVEIWLVRGGQLQRWPGGSGGEREPSALRSLEGAGAIDEAVRSNATTRDQDVLAVPIALAGQVVAVFSAKRDARTEQGASGAVTLEPLVRYAAKSLEALTAFKTARALTQQPEPAPAAGPSPVPDEASEEETSARRYARLLVSEIKLYHESAVVEGRRDGDLATRLGGEIARARVMYEQRVPPHVRVRADYFQDELVRTLAGGDATLLAFGAQNSELGT